MRKRIDRFIEDALGAFTRWYVDSTWLGKERDCVNMFAMNFLAKAVEPGAAISELGQIRIESPVPQPKGFAKITAAKDLVIWGNSYVTAWDKEWNAPHYPRAVLEWKIKRSGRPPAEFHSHDINWLSGFTSEFQDTFGYLIRVYDGPHGRAVDWAKVRGGAINATNRRS
jgi:hypothetical protein